MTDSRRKRKLLSLRYRTRKALREYKRRGNQGTQHLDSLRASDTELTQKLDTLTR